MQQVGKPQLLPEEGSSPPICPLEFPSSELSHSLQALCRHQAGTVQRSFSSVSPAPPALGSQLNFTAETAGRRSPEFPHILVPRQRAREAGEPEAQHNIAHMCLCFTHRGNKYWQVTKKEHVLQTIGVT